MIAIKHSVTATLITMPLYGGMAASAMVSARKRLISLCVSVFCIVSALAMSGIIRKKCCRRQVIRL